MTAPFVQTRTTSHVAQRIEVSAVQSTSTAEPVSGIPGQVVEKLEVICGPLINFKSMDVGSSALKWHGSVLIVTEPGQQQPQLELRQAGPVASDSDLSQANSNHRPNWPTTVYNGTKLFEDPAKVFWRFSISAALETYEARWEYCIPGFHYVSATDVVSSPWHFIVPSINQSMRIMFYSCNGFSIGTDMNVWVGPNLWNEVLRIHGEKPFHVMIGGGDQIYCDGVRVEGPLKSWTDIATPHKRRTHSFDEVLKAACDEYYYNNYVQWYSKKPFRIANGQIPQINIWDDHDIIDGFGSYTDHFMRSPVFRGIGGVALKYYCLFQHHIAPPGSTFTTDDIQTTHSINGTAGDDLRQLQNTYILQEQHEDPSWIIGKRPGPYVEERSRSLYMRLGIRMAFLGIDGRMERTLHQVNYPETYDAVFDRLEREVATANGEIKHLILLLGIPIAYPRLTWLENIFRSPLIALIRLLNKRFGFAGSLFNKFDENVDLLDDLDDHYTARHHKAERKQLILRLQKFSQTHSVRVTILGGDVHLAGIGRFYSNPKLGIRSENDYRFMVNIISSAITNKPPPKAVANLLARRNKIHHLDADTDETLVHLFDKQPGGIAKCASWNHVTMPSRNFAVITEVPSSAPGNVAEAVPNPDLSFPPKNGHLPIHEGEVNAGTTHPAADAIHASQSSIHMTGGLDVSIRVEIDPHNRSATTEGYGFNIPPLTVGQSVPTTTDCPIPGEA